MPTTGDGRPSGPTPGAVQLLQLGTTCGFCIGLGVFLGYLLDQALGTAPLLTFVGMAIGILGAAAGAFYLLRPYVTGARTGRQNPKD
jgi:F0F1-type ATP synthase assembly protein I